MLPTNPMSVRRLKMKEELDLMEAEAMKKGQEQSPTQSVKENEEGSPSENAEAIAGQEKAKEKQNEPVQDLQYWKDRCLTSERRFNTTKPKYDSNIYKLKQDNLGLSKKIVELSKTLNQERQAAASKKVNPLDEVFDQEQVDVLGQKTVDVIKNKFKETADRLDAQDQKAEDKRIADSEQNIKDRVNAEYKVFKDRLKELVPNLNELNRDKEFIAWLQEPDEISRDIRQVILLNAESSRDVGRVAELFNQYKTVSKPPVDSINKRIAPAGNEGTNTVTDIAKRGDTMTMAEVNKFYDDVQKGAYKGRYSERVAMSERIDQAQMSGNII